MCNILDEMKKFPSNKLTLWVDTKNCANDKSNVINSKIILPHYLVMYCSGISNYFLCTNSLELKESLTNVSITIRRKVSNSSIINSIFFQVKFVLHQLVWHRWPTLLKPTRIVCIHREMSRVHVIYYHKQNKKYKKRFHTSLSPPGIESGGDKARKYPPNRYNRTLAIQISKDRHSLRRVKLANDRIR